MIMISWCACIVTDVNLHLSSNGNKITVKTVFTKKTKLLDPGQFLRSCGTHTNKTKKRNKNRSITMVMCPLITILCASPKQGGILQSSGFLDLKSLMALSRTCKAHALDEQSLIQLIENEATRTHVHGGSSSVEVVVKTMDEAIDFWRNIYRHRSLLKQWLERDGSGSGSGALESIKVTRDMLIDALPYEVMLVQMLRTVPTESE